MRYVFFFGEGGASWGGKQKSCVFILCVHVTRRLETNQWFILVLKDNSGLFQMHCQTSWSSVIKTPDLSELLVFRASVHFAAVASPCSQIPAITGVSAVL